MYPIKIYLGRIRDDLLSVRIRPVFIPSGASLLRPRLLTEDGHLVTRAPILESN
jgi:hypothetical protein